MSSPRESDHDIDATAASETVDATVVDTRMAIADTVAVDMVQEQFDAPASTARQIYADAYAKQRLIEVGDHFLDTDRLDEAQEVYAVAGEQIPSAKLVALANHWFAQGERQAALAAYALAKIEVPREQLIICGEALLKGYGPREDAIAAFKAAGAIERVIELANMWLARGKLDDARTAYGYAGANAPKEKLVELGDKLVAYGEPMRALDAYRDAGAAIKRDALLDRTEKGWSHKSSWVLANNERVRDRSAIPVESNTTQSNAGPKDTAQLS